MELQHFGIKGMKWGVRKRRDFGEKGNPLLSTKRTDKARSKANQFSKVKAGVKHPGSYLVYGKKYTQELERSNKNKDSFKKFRETNTKNRKAAEQKLANKMFDNKINKNKQNKKRTLQEIANKYDLKTRKISSTKKNYNKMVNRKKVT